MTNLPIQWAVILQPVAIKCFWYPTLAIWISFLHEIQERLHPRNSYRPYNDGLHSEQVNVASALCPREIGAASDKKPNIYPMQCISLDRIYKIINICLWTRLRINKPSVSVSILQKRFCSQKFWKKNTFVQFHILKIPFINSIISVCFVSHKFIVKIIIIITNYKRCFHRLTQSTLISLTITCNHAVENDLIRL